MAESSGIVLAIVLMCLQSVVSKIYLKFHRRDASSSI
jgi:hypothetical protein